MSMHRRGFVEIEAGQVHYRHAGAGSAVPLVMLHAAPAASITLAPLLEALSATRPAYAPDCLGMGESAPLPTAAPDLSLLAAATWQAIDALSLERIDLYGSLTGARMAVEMAILAPHRVRRLVLDGISLLDAAEMADYLANYAPQIEPALDGTQFAAAWHFCRDQYLFFPWYKRDAAHRRDVALPAPGLLHVKVLDVLMSLQGFPAVLRASLAYPATERMKLLAVPTLAEAALAPFIAPMTVMRTSMLEPLTASAERLAAKAVEIAAFLDS